MSTDFLASDMRTRVLAILDPESWSSALHDCGTLHCGYGKIAARSVAIAATDPRHASGAIGIAECEGLFQLISRAQQDKVPLVLLLDSAGAKLTDGVKVLGGFRRVQRALLNFVATGGLCVAVLGQHCFGGASLLAFAAASRVYPKGARIGLSGPRALAAAAGMPAATFYDFYGSDARQAVDRYGYFTLNDTVAVRAAVSHALSSRAIANAIADRHNVLHERLSRFGSSAPMTLADAKLEHAETLERYMDLSAVRVMRNGFLRGEAPLHGWKIRMAGFVNARPVDAQMCWQLADFVLQDTAATSGPLLLLLDSPGQVASAEQEQLLISKYVAHLAQVIHQVVVSGRRVDLFITGEAGGAIYVALAGAVDTIYALREAQLQTLPQNVVAGVLGKPLSDPVTSAALIEHGVIDVLGVPFSD